MAYTVLYLANAPRSNRAVTLSAQPPEFRDLWLESDDPAELRAKLAEADFIVGGRVTAAAPRQAPDPGARRRL